MLNLKLQYFGHLKKNWLTGKDLDTGKDGRWEEKETTEEGTAGWHHRLNGHEFQKAPGVDDGQGSLACCSLWCLKESDTTDWLNWTELNGLVVFPYLLQSNFEFCNKGFMIWPTVRHRSCFCWLYKASSSFTAKKIINLSSILTIWWCVEWFLVKLRGCLL